MGSGAGLNTGSGYLLVGCNSSTGSVTNPLTGYGTLGPGGNDSGGALNEYRGYKAIRFQLVPTSSTAVTGAQVSIYVTTLPEANQTYWYALQGRTPQGASALPAGGSPNNLADAAHGFSPGIPGYAWTLMDGLADQSGTGVSANPMTTTSTLFVGNSAGIISVRAVITSACTGGSFSVSYVVIP